MSATYSITGNQVFINVIMQDLHAPGTMWPTVITSDGGTVDLGTLTEGFYEVDATMRMIPWFGGSPAFHNSGIGSFYVVPEPSTWGLLVIGSFVLAGRRL